MSEDLPDPRPSRAADPLWMRCADRIQEEIARRGLTEGHRLPPERELCALLSVSRVTLRRALTELDERGVVVPSHGRGWFVAAPAAPAPAREWPKELESFTATARRKHMRPGSLVIRSETVTAGLDDAEALEVPAGTPLFRLERVRTLNGVRVAVDHALLLLDAAPDLPRIDFTSASLFAELARWGKSPDLAEATIEAQVADARLAELLGCPRGGPVLVLDQLIRTRDGRPLMRSRVEYSGERHRLRMTLQSG
ncbi:GntR family transcriptional regulator [Streptomyces sp. NPDC048659]|uniref:GntR family transcriptional regulator n=1 Tax=Streptomyces sp. NPDC048659 TaxID=3155489 RepID=UPI0034480EA2